MVGASWDPFNYYVIVFLREVRMCGTALYLVHDFCYFSKIFLCRQVDSDAIFD